MIYTDLSKDIPKNIRHAIECDNHILVYKAYKTEQDIYTVIFYKDNNTTFIKEVLESATSIDLVEAWIKYKLQR